MANSDDWREQFLAARAACVKDVMAEHWAKGYTGWGSGRSALSRGFIEGVLWAIEASGLATEEAAPLREVVRAVKRDRGQVVVLREMIEAESDPPEGARPARDTGVSVPFVDWGKVPVEVCELLTAGMRAKWRVEAERDAALQERDEARDAAEIINEALEMMDRAFHQLQGERDAARAALAEAVRSQELAEAEEAVMFGKAAALQRERDEARAAARAYLPHVKYSYDFHNRGEQYERAERERLSWLGPPETPLEEC